jgi:D-ribose pyranase
VGAAPKLFDRRNIVQLKGEILNSRLAGGIVRLGHRDRIVVTDAGLPLPWAVETVDLAVIPGMPSLEQILKVILSELKIEAAIVAEEFQPESPDVYQKVANLLTEVELRTVPQAELEEMVSTAKLIVRTGECSHYGNVILVASVTF